MFQQAKDIAPPIRLPDHFYKTKEELLEMLEVIIENNKREQEKEKEKEKE